MQIEFERSGGVAGMTIRTTVDTDSLPSAEGSELGQMINTAGFFNLPAQTKAGPGADQFNYKLTVTVQGLSHTVETGDSSMPASLRPLVDRLMSMARAPRQA